MFIKLEKTTRRNSEIHASLSVKGNSGFLRFTRLGMEALQINRIEIKPGQPLDIFVDTETKQVGFKYAKDSPFKFTAAKSGSWGMYYRALRDTLVEPQHYRIGYHANFDLLLVPIPK